MVVEDERERLLAGAVLLPTTERSTGLRQLRLAGCFHSDLIALGQLCQAAASLASPLTRWLAVDSQTSDELSQVGFEPVERTLVLGLKELVFSDGTTMVRPALEEDRTNLIELSSVTLDHVVCQPPGVELAEVLQRRRGYQKEFYRELAFAEPEIAVLVATEAGAIAGYAVLDLQRGHIDDLSVHPNFWGRRVGHRLWRAVVTLAKQHQLESLYAQVAERNPRSWKSAARLGFQVSSVRYLKVL